MTKGNTSDPRCSRPLRRRLKSKLLSNDIWMIYEKKKRNMKKKPKKFNVYVSTQGLKQNINDYPTRKTCVVSKTRQTPNNDKTAGCKDILEPKLINENLEKITGIKENSESRVRRCSISNRSQLLVAHKIKEIVGESDTNITQETSTKSVKDVKRLFKKRRRSTGLELLTNNIKNVNDKNMTRNIEKKNLNTRNLNLDKKVTFSQQRLQRFPRERCLLSNEAHIFRKANGNVEVDNKTKARRRPRKIRILENESLSESVKKDSGQRHSRKHHKSYKPKEIQGDVAMDYKRKPRGRRRRIKLLENESLLESVEKDSGQRHSRKRHKSYKPKEIQGNVAMDYKRKPRGRPRRIKLLENVSLLESVEKVSGQRQLRKHHKSYMPKEMHGTVVMDNKIKPRGLPRRTRVLKNESLLESVEQIRRQRQLRKHYKSYMPKKVHGNVEIDKTKPRGRPRRIRILENESLKESVEKDSGQRQLRKHHKSYMPKEMHRNLVMDYKTKPRGRPCRIRILENESLIESVEKDSGQRQLRKHHKSYMPKEMHRNLVMDYKIKPRGRPRRIENDSLLESVEENSGKRQLRKHHKSYLPKKMLKAVVMDNKRKPCGRPRRIRLVENESLLESAEKDNKHRQLEEHRKSYTLKEMYSNVVIDNNRKPRGRPRRCGVIKNESFLESIKNEKEIGRRQLRQHRKSYIPSSELSLLEGDVDLRSLKDVVYYMSYNLADKLKNTKYTGHGVLKHLNGHSFNKEYVQENGFTYPIVIRKKRTLRDFLVPGCNFTVNDICKYVGPERLLDVIDVHTQKDVQMTMREYQSYLETQPRAKLYNIISLEISHTQLSDKITQPAIIRKLDWVDLFWPECLRKQQMDGTNTLLNMMYPKVQKYCLMSIKGCYTDFHIDFGGTSVWYHVVSGAKVFWLAPPTEHNLSMYRKWLMTDKMMDGTASLFLGEWLESCERVVLKMGQTFFLPSGWLHAVYTPKDTIVFGGNFLHSHSVDMQLKIYRFEEEMRVLDKCRYPFFIELHWFVLNGYVSALDPDWHSQFGETSGIIEMQHSVCKDNEHTLKNIKLILDYFSENFSNVTNRVPKELPHWVKLLKHAVVLVNNHDSLTSTKYSEIIRALDTKNYAGNSKQKYDLRLSNCHKDSYDKEHNELIMKFEDSIDVNHKDQMKHSNVEVTLTKLCPKILVINNNLKKVTSILDDIQDGKKLPPEQLSDPVVVLKEAVKLLNQHKSESCECTYTNLITRVEAGKISGMRGKRKHVESVDRMTPSNTLVSNVLSSLEMGSGNKVGVRRIRHRRRRCLQCFSCLNPQCGKCNWCRDKPKFGESFSNNKRCVGRKCEKPKLPVSAKCSVCYNTGDLKHVDYMARVTVYDNIAMTHDDTSGVLDQLMECITCYEVLHPRCLFKMTSLFNSYDVKQHIYKHLLNCWKCPKCLVSQTSTQATNGSEKSRKSGNKIAH